MIIVRGSGDVGSAVAHTLFARGYQVHVHDEPHPPHIRRTLAFTDALFEGSARLAGLMAKRAASADSIRYMLRCRGAVSISSAPWDDVVATMPPLVVVDARMRKRLVPERQRELAPLTIGLGPNFTAGDNVHVAIETAWGPNLGDVIHDGSTKDLTGEPRELGGYSRDRFVYASAPGVFRTSLSIGTMVDAGQVVGTVGDEIVRAPLSGRLRGISHDSAVVGIGTKLLEIDPRNDAQIPWGLGQRPTAIANGVLTAIVARHA